MSRAVATIDGLDQLRSALKETPKRARRVLRDMLKESATAVMYSGRANAPRETGALIRAIQVDGRGLSWRAGLSDRAESIGGRQVWPFVYGRFIEYGTKRREARPFMRPAADGEATKIEGRLRVVARVLETEAAQ
jgi:HK97 gp10 family phage protein